MDIITPFEVKDNDKPIGRRPNFTPEYYMIMAKEVVDDGLSFRKAAKKYKCSHGTVSHWSKLYKQGRLTKRIEKSRKSQSKIEIQLQYQERYIKELKAQVGELYLENQLLKKAQEYFRLIKSEDTSVITSENLDQFQKDAK